MQWEVANCKDVCGRGAAPRMCMCTTANVQARVNV